jgi:hypothetical protein
MKGTRWKLVFGVGWWKIMWLVPSCKRRQWPELCTWTWLRILLLTKFPTDQRFNIMALPHITAVKCMFLESDFSWSVDPKRRTHCLATKVTRSYPTRLLFVGIHEEHCLPTECVKFSGTEGMHHEYSSTDTPNMARDWISFGHLLCAKGCTHWVILTSNVNLESFITITCTLYTNKPVSLLRISFCSLIPLAWIL